MAEVHAAAGHTNIALKGINLHVGCASTTILLSIRVALSAVRDAHQHPPKHFVRQYLH
jgi:hypothetical protein